MTGEWKLVGEKPQIAEGTKLAVLMRGSAIGTSRGNIVEVEGYYLNGYRLTMRDGCECFPANDESDEAEDHREYGCPWHGFHVVEDDPDGQFSELYVEFGCIEWCKR